MTRSVLLAAALMAASPTVAQEPAAPAPLAPEMLLLQVMPDGSDDPLALPGEGMRLPEARSASVNELRESFEGTAIADAELAGATCEAGRCTVELRLAAEEPAELPDRLLAIEDWIADASPCPYAISIDPAASGGPQVRAAIDCGG